MTEKHSGGCHCGEVRYSFSAAPKLTFFCHCTDCQKSSGGPFLVEMMISAEDLACEGKLASYSVTGDSGQSVHRCFCPKCGSGLFLEGDADRGQVFLRVGTLDDASWVKPQCHIYTASRQPWVELNDSLPAFERAPPTE